MIEDIPLLPAEDFFQFISSTASCVPGSTFSKDKLRAAIPLPEPLLSHVFTVSGVLVPFLHLFLWFWNHYCNSSSSGSYVASDHFISGLTRYVDSALALTARNEEVKRYQSATQLNKGQLQKWMLEQEPDLVNTLPDLFRFFSAGYKPPAMSSGSSSSISAPIIRPQPLADSRRDILSGVRKEEQGEDGEDGEGEQLVSSHPDMLMLHLSGRSVAAQWGNAFS